MAEFLNNPIFELAPNFAGIPTLAVSTVGSIIGEGFGPRLAQFSGKHPRHTLNHEWHLKTALEIKQFCQFFDQQAGRWGGFFMPSYHAEIEPIDDVLDGATEIHIDEIGYFDAFNINGGNAMALGSSIALIHRDGSRHYARITDVLDGNPERLIIDPPVDRDWLIGEFFISFLYYVRFVNDLVTLDFNGPNEATVRAPMIENILVGEENVVEGSPKSTEDTGAPPAAAPSDGEAEDVFVRHDGETFTDASGNEFTVN
jgi:hypothetical protein